MDQKQTLKNNLYKRCDSCGNPHSCMKYNNSHLCVQCLRMDSVGVARGSNGRVLGSNVSEIKDTLEKPRKRKL